MGGLRPAYGSGEDWNWQDVMGGEQTDSLIPLAMRAPPMAEGSVTLANLLAEYPAYGVGPAAAAAGNRASPRSAAANVSP